MSARRTAFQVTLVAATYYVAAHVGLLLALPGTNVAPLWPPTGIALAAVIMWGRRAAIGVVVGELVANTQIFVTDGMALAPAAGISLLWGLGNAAEALVGAWLYARWVGDGLPGQSAGNAWGTIRTAFTMSTVSATVGISTLFAFGMLPGAAVATTAATWLLGNVSGVLLLTPLILSAARRTGPVFAPMRRPEGIALALASALVPALLYSGASPAAPLAAPLVLTPIAVWAIIRGNMVTSSATVFSLTAITLLAILMGQAAFLDGASWLRAVETNLLMATSLGLMVTTQGIVSQFRRTEERQDALAKQLEQRVAQQTALIRDSHARVSAIIDHAMESIITFNAQGDIIEGNPASRRLFGHPDDPTAPPYTHIKDCLPSVTPEVWRKRHLMELTSASGQPVEVSFASWEFNGTPYFTAFARDVRERHRAEADRRQAVEAQAELERMREADAFRSAFINQAAHELRTPLTPLLLQVALLQRMADQLPPANRKGILTLERNMRRLKRIVDDLLDAGRYQAGKMSVATQPEDLGDILRTACDEHAPTMEAAGLEFEVDIKGPLPVDGDVDRLTQVMHNLLSNAVKYTPNGKVSVRARAVDGLADVTVSDTGLGFDAAQKKLLFEPFSRAHEDRGIPGTGLGLYVSRALVRLHGGDLLGRSAGPGKGSTFRITIPLHVAPELPAARQ